MKSRMVLGIGVMVLILFALVAVLVYLGGERPVQRMEAPVNKEALVG